MRVVLRFKLAHYQEVRFGSKTDLMVANASVRLVPQAGDNDQAAASALATADVVASEAVVWVHDRTIYPMNRSWARTLGLYAAILL